MEQNSQTGREAVVEGIRLEVGGGSPVMKNEMGNHEILQLREQQQQQQQLGYIVKEEGGDDVGVLEAGHSEIENGVMLEPTGAEVITLNVATNHQDGPNPSYTLHQLGYQEEHHIIHDR